jgi:membrane fusion protein, adhesin transport system
MNTVAEPLAPAPVPSGGPVAAGPVPAPARPEPPDWSLGVWAEGGLGQHERLRLPLRLVRVVAVLMLLALVWMAFARVDRVVRATGRIVPSERAQVVQHLEGGIVAGILVREGQVVEKDSELVLISDVQAQSQVGERTVRLNALRAQLRRLQAEAQGGRAGSEGATSAPDIEREMQLLAARRDRLEQGIRVLREQLEQRRQEIREAETRKRGLQKEHAIATQQLGLVNDMISRQAASRMELLEAQSRVERFASQMQDIDASIPKAQAAIRELEGKIAEATSQFRSEAHGKLSEVAVEIHRIEEEISAGKDRLKRRAVRSPVRGVVNRVYTSTVGGVVRAGDPLVEITPLDERVDIEAVLSPMDRAELRVGLPAVVRVSAYDYAIYGTLKGQVAELSADTLPDDKGQRYYRVRIAVDPESTRAFGRELTPGMTVSADVVFGERTVMQYVMSPMTRFLSGALRDRK